MTLVIEESCPHISQWLPDETLFSLCSRIHLLSGNHRPDATCRSLFGHPRQGSSHDIPVRVDDFTSRTHGAFGDSQTVVLERTILPFYLRQASTHLIEDALAIARSSSLGNLKARLGLLASRFGASHPLKACPQCIQEDRDIHHVSYWHRDHQWPGAWMCLKHRAPLVRGLGKVNTRGRFHWYLPADLSFVPPAMPDAIKTAKPTLMILTECAVAFGGGIGQDRFDPRQLEQTYRARLAKRRVLGFSGRIATSDFAAVLSSSLSPLSPIYGLEALAEAQTSLTNQFLRLIQSHRGIVHPLRHLLLIVALFESWVDFLEAYHFVEHEPCQPETDVPDETKAGPPLTRTDPLREKFLNLVRQGASVTSAASSVGVAVATAMAWFAASGASISRRPKALTPELRRLAIARLRRGAAKGSVADAIGMSVQTVTLLLRTEPGLQDAWHAARFQKAQRVARTNWQRTANRLPFPSPKALREAQPAIFAWLYRNDRAWFISFTQTLPRLPRTNNANIQWDRRDEDLAQSVRLAALGFASTHGQRRPRVSDLCDAIGTLKRRLGSLDRLPLTRAAIRDATRSRTTA